MPAAILNALQRIMTSAVIPVPVLRGALLYPQRSELYTHFTVIMIFLYSDILFSFPIAQGPIGLVCLLVAKMMGAAQVVITGKIFF